MSRDARACLAPLTKLARCPTGRQPRSTVGHVRPSSYVAVALAVFILATCPGAAIAATAEQAKAFSERAAAYIEQVGDDQAFEDFTRKDGGFVDGELYVFCYDRNGINKAHGGNPAFVGRNLLHIKDPDGAEPNLLIVKMGFEQGRGWVNFKWPNPVTKRIENKSAYVIRTGDVACGVGYYTE
jgi:cytochrome c